MGDLVNLNRVRKRVARDRAAEQADVNRLRFGRSKAERARQTEQAERAAAMLEGHRLDPEVAQ